MDWVFRLIGTTPLLMHRDDVMSSDILKEWRIDPKNAARTTAGDDRFPPWSWQTYLYNDGTNLALPQECLMGALRYAGAKVKGVGQSTFKALTQSGMVITCDMCEFLSNGRPVPLASILALKDMPFGRQAELVQRFGFTLFVKRAPVKSSKHVRVRPHFVNWEVRGTLTVIEPAITPAILAQLFEIAGTKSGLGDWRPSSPKSPGPHGMFRAELTPAKTKRKSA